MASQRGLESNQELNYSQIIRDTRPLSTRIYDFFSKPRHASLTLLVLVAASWILPYLADVFFLLGIGIFIFAITRRFRLPFRMPLRSKQKDYNDTLPGSNKARKARGIYFFGNDKKSKEELWFTNEDMRTHVLIFGSTGSGKTEALVSLAYNALLQASGFIYVDGKGDNSLFSKIFSMVRSMGREDDLLLINYMTGARDVVGPQEKKLSNTINPFAQGSSSMLSQLVVSLMDSASQSSDGDMWKGRAISFVEALMKVLVAMRDAGNILLDAHTVRNYFHLDRIEAMVMDKVFVRDGQEPVSLESLPSNILEPIENYLFNLPGYNKEKKGKQVSQVLEQHGFITMQLTRVFTSLADTYGHIMRTKLAEVDMKDVVLNRRILVVLLPALEKSPDELANLGKVIIATLRAMMAAGLGEHVEGELADIVESKPTNATTPYLCILDEYGYYAVKGFAVVPAQARSLGFSVVFAGQDLPAFEKASKEEAASIGANTNIKICMKLEDPKETWDFFMKTAGESYVSHVESFQMDAGSVLGNYQDARGARLEKRARVDLLDLKEQREGEAHIFFKSKIVRARMFYANPKLVKKMRLNHFLKVDEPLDAEIYKLATTFHNFEKVVNGAIPFSQPINVADDEVKTVSEHLQAAQNDSLFIRSVKALEKLQPKNKPLTPGQSAPVEEDYSNYSDNKLNAFLPMRLSSHLDGLIITNDIKQFRRPILQRTQVRDQIEYIERLLAKTPQQAMNVAMNLIGDIQRGTLYPPANVKLKIDGPELAKVVDQLIKNIKLKKEEHEKSGERK